MSGFELNTLQRIAVVGRGTAGSLAAATVSKLGESNEIELHHIYDSGIPVIGVGEGGWPALVTQLHDLTEIPHENIQQRLKATRKYGVRFEGWGKLNKDFTHYFTPQQIGYSYHLSADLITELLKEATNAQHIDDNVISITKTGKGAEIVFEKRPSEHYDLVFDARGFPKSIDEEQHITIPFIPTNTAIIRRCPSIINQKIQGPYLHPTYTRSIARPHGWVFVIPLTSHTSYGYIFNNNCSDFDEVESDFDNLLDIEGITEFEKRAVISFPNFVHRQMYDGTIARIGNAGAFMEPLEATAIVSAQLQIGMVLRIRQNRPSEYMEGDIKPVNNFLINSMLGYGLFVGWHYSCGSKYQSAFWRYASMDVWPIYRSGIDLGAGKYTALEKFDSMLELLNNPVIDKVDLIRQGSLPITSFAQISHGLGCYPLLQ
ncbi:MAG: tryptophan 7-halogenase [Rhodobacteraceae bacterium]|nr:tryptophan 7-halogenase [Paracoccaceae bacterium]